MADQLLAARAELEAARGAAEALANDEASNLGSDEAFHSWSRRKRLAEIEVGRLADVVTSLEADVTSHAAQIEIDRYRARYDAAAECNRKVADMIRTDLAQAWSIVSSVLEAAALAEIETAAVLRSMPAGFQPTQSIGDPEDARRRPSLEEKVLGEETVSLWVDAETGNLFADQSRRPTKRAIAKMFRQTTVLPARRGDSPPPFFRELVFPRIDQNGPAMFDGRSLQSPEQVLRALAEPRPTAKATSRSSQIRIEPMSGSTVAPSADLGPALP